MHIPDLPGVSAHRAAQLVVGVPGGLLIAHPQLSPLVRSPSACHTRVANATLKPLIAAELPLPDNATPLLERVIEHD
ncbi:hypothetical protein GCM10010452_60870 [Crossiella cryophila]